MSVLATQLVMPQMGYDMEEGTLVRWLKAEGDEVRRGEPIAEIETDKAVVEMESIASGILRKTIIGEGVTVPVGSAIGVVGAADEDISQYETQAPAPPAPARSAVPETPAPPAALEAPAEPAPSEAGIKASPVARRIARELGVDLAQVKGTGPGGRIVREDVETYAASSQAPSVPATPMGEMQAPAPSVQPSPAFVSEEPQRVELSRMRQAIARATSQSKQGTPHFYVTIEVDMTEALALRTKINETLSEQVRVTINDLVLRSVVIALKRYPNLNASYRDDYVEIHPHINLGIAIAREQGLIVPAIVNAQDKSLVELAAASKDLAERVQSGRLRQEEYNGTFSTSNLGMFGVDEFSAIILPPQAAVLAISAIKKQPVVCDDQVVVRQMMKLTISVDHRVSDGVEGARFVQELKGILERPVSLLL